MHVKITRDGLLMLGRKREGEDKYIYARCVQDRPLGKGVACHDYCPAFYERSDFDGDASPCVQLMCLPTMPFYTICEDER